MSAATLVSCALILAEAGPAVTAVVDDAVVACPLLGHLLHKVKLPVWKVPDFLLGAGWDGSSAKAVAKALVPKLQRVEKVSVFLFTGLATDAVASATFPGSLTIGSAREAFAAELGMPILRLLDTLPFTQSHRVLADEDEPLCLSEPDKDGDVCFVAGLTAQDVEAATVTSTCSIFRVTFKLAGDGSEVYSGRVCAYSSVASLLRELTRLGLPPMKLIHEGKTLQADRALGDYGILEQATLYLVPL